MKGRAAPLSDVPLTAVSHESDGSPQVLPREGQAQRQVDAHRQTDSHTHRDTHKQTHTQILRHTDTQPQTATGRDRWIPLFHAISSSP